MSPRSLFVGACSLVAVSILLTACQRLQEPVPTLTQDQWRRVQEHLLDEPPTVDHPVDAVFDGHFRLIGWNIEPASPNAGEEITVTYYWEVIEETNQRWRIFVHLDSATSRQNLDHEAVGGIYPTVYWEKGQIIEDSVTDTLGPNLGDGEINMYLGFFREGGDGARMPITRAGRGALQPDGRLHVGSFSATWESPEYEIRRTRESIEIDGDLTERAWRRARATDNWVNPNSGEEVDGLRTVGRMLWDDEFLYIGVTARDGDIWSTLTERDDNLWEEEVIEVYLDPGSDGRNYLEIQVNPLNTVFDALFPSPNQRDLASAKRHTVPGMETAVQVAGTVDDRGDDDREWSVEMKIPFSSLPDMTNVPPRSGDEMAVNFYRYDRDSDDSVRTAAWSPVGGGSFHNPDRFGTVTFRGGPRTPTRALRGRGGSEQEGEGDDPPGVRVNPEIQLQRLQIPQRAVPTPAQQGGGGGE